MVDKGACGGGKYEQILYKSSGQMPSYFLLEAERESILSHIL